MRLRPLRHRRPLPGWLLPALVIPGMVLGGCKDDRGAPTAPDTGVLDGGVLFGSAQISSLYFTFQNEMAARVLALHESPGLQLPVQFQGCAGDGVALLTDNNDADPNTYRITFGDASTGLAFVFNCAAGLPLSFTGALVIRFVETAPGLDYTIELPFDHATGTPEGVTMQLPQDIGGGAILQMTTPFGSMRCTLVGERDTLPTGGIMQLRGTLRLEDREIPMTLVEELALDYTVGFGPPPGTQDLLVFSTWPSGAYEIASNAVGAPGTLPPPGYPVEVFFNGLGGASFEFEGHSCDTNMQTGENPCEQF